MSFPCDFCGQGIDVEHGETVTNLGTSMEVLLACEKCAEIEE